MSNGSQPGAEREKFNRGGGRVQYHRKEVQLHITAVVCQLQGASQNQEAKRAHVVLGAVLQTSSLRRPEALDPVEAHTGVTFTDTVCGTETETVVVYLEEHKAKRNKQDNKKHCYNSRFPGREGGRDGERIR